MPKPDPGKLSAYGVIKTAQVVHSLPPEDQEAVERLERRKKVSPSAEARLGELWHRAFDLHRPPQMDPLFAYTEEVGVRLRVRLRAEAAEDATEDEGRDDR